MVKSLSNFFDKNLLRHYLNFERGNPNPEYHRRLKAFRQRQNFETNPKKSLTALQIDNSISFCYYYNKVFIDFTETHTSARIYHKELKWLLLS